MKRQILAIGLVCAALFVGCGQKDKVLDNSKTMAESSDENSGNTTDSETDADQSDKATSDAEKDNTSELNPEAVPEDENEESAADSETIADGLLNNNGYFVSYNGKVYFHGPDDAAMKSSAMFGQYMNNDCGDTILYEYDTKTGECRAYEKDHGWGKLLVSGNSIFFSTSEVYGDDPTLAIGMTAIGEDKGPGLNTYPMDLIAGDADGHYVLGGYNVSDDSGIITSSVIVPFIDGMMKDPITVDDVYIQAYSVVTLLDNQLVYLNRVYESFEYTGTELLQTDLDSGETIKLGVMPDFEFGDGEIDQVECVGRQIYIGYSCYEGTGHFFSKAKLVTAELGKENSAASADARPLSDEYGDSVYAPFYIKNGVVKYGEGIPNTAEVKDDNLGYYNEEGKFVKVASGYGTTMDDDSENFYHVEVAELIGDYIYFVQNISDRVPEDDIGWRYFYRRRENEIMRVNIDTGKVETLVKNK